MSTRTAVAERRTIEKRPVLISTDLVADVINQLSSVPQADLTIERVAATFADRLENNFTTFDRDDFQHKTGVSARMIEDAEAKAAGAMSTPESLELDASGAKGQGYGLGDDLDDDGFDALDDAEGDIDDKDQGEPSLENILGDLSEEEKPGPVAAKGDGDSSMPGW